MDRRAWKRPGRLRKWGTSCKGQEHRSLSGLPKIWIISQPGLLLFYVMPCVSNSLDVTIQVPCPGETVWHVTRDGQGVPLWFVSQAGEVGWDPRRAVDRVVKGVGTTTSRVDSGTSEIRAKAVLANPTDHARRATLAWTTKQTDSLDRTDVLREPLNRSSVMSDKGYYWKASFVVMT